MLRVAVLLFALVSTVSAQEAGKCSFSAMVRAVFVANQLLTQETTEPLEKIEPDDDGAGFVSDSDLVSEVESVDAATIPIFPPATYRELTDAERLQRLTWQSLFGHKLTRISQQCAFFPVNYSLNADTVGRWAGQSLLEVAYPSPGTYCQRTSDWRWYPLTVVKRKPNASAHRLPQRGQRAALLAEFKSLAAACGFEQKQ